MTEILQQILGNDWESALVIILNLIIIESLLSVDNAAVLATMVMDLPQHQRARALRYGILGAYVFRGLCLIFAAWLIQIWWLKPLGGLYLLHLTYGYFIGKATPQTNDDLLMKEEKWFYKMTYGLMGQFWATVMAVEIMDLAFSLDNVFAAVAFTDNIWLVCIGVFIGILAMRFVAQWFVKLLERYPFLETSAFLVIGILGVKLLLSLPSHYYAGSWWAAAIESETTDLLFSVLTASFFFVPIVTSRFWGWPKPAASRPEVEQRDEHTAPTQAGQPAAAANGVSEKKEVLAERQAMRITYRPLPGPSHRTPVRTTLNYQTRHHSSPLPSEQKSRFREG